MNVVAKKAREIVNSEYMNPQARVITLREIREAHSAVFEKMVDAGVFERTVGTLDAAIRNPLLPDDKKQAMAAVLVDWGPNNCNARYRSR